MNQVYVKPAPSDHEWKVGDEFFRAEGNYDGTLYVEGARVTEITQMHRQERSDGEWVRVPSYKQANYRTDTGAQSSFSFDVQRDGIAGTGERVLLAATEEDGYSAMAYERTGTAVTVTMLVAESNQRKAELLVQAALADLDADMEHTEVVSREAYDRTGHYFAFSDGRVLATSVPHWAHRTMGGAMGMSTVVSGVVPPMEAQRQVAGEAAQRDALLRSGGGTQGPHGARRRRKPGRVLTTEERKQVVEDRESMSVAAIATKYSVSVPTIYKILRASEERTS